jgi:PAS domain S-box-containing protein
MPASRPNLIFDKTQNTRLVGIFLPPGKSLTTSQSALTIVCVIAVCTILGMMMSTFLDRENVIMIYLAGVMYIATRCGVVMSVCACVLSVLAFDFFIVLPVFSFLPEDPRYSFTFAIMFAVAMVMSGLTHQIKAQRLAHLDSFIRQAELLDLTYDAIMVWDLDNYRISYWNSGAEKMYGLRKDQAIGQSLIELLHAEYPCALEDIVRQVRVDGRWDGEITYKRFNGDPITVASRWTLKSAAAGDSETIVEFATDITERKIADKRVKEFHSTVSHELRTPLTSIIGGLSLLAHNVVAPGSSKGSELIALAKTQSEKLMALVNDMLDLQKIEAGKLELHTSQVHMDDIIESVVAELVHVAADENIVLTKDIQSNPALEADPVRIAQVLTNLLANAIKFSPAGSEIQVNTESRKDRLRVSVLDCGPGIAGDQMSKLFCKFRQLDSSDTRRHGGTGLGLAISKAIVEQHRGEIGVDSEVGRGSTFWFELLC